MTPGEEQHAEPSRVDRFMRDSFAGGMLKCRSVPAAISVAIFLAFTAYMAYCASLLQTPTQQEQFFPSSHMFERVKVAWVEDYKAAAEDQLVPIAVVFGVDEFDRTGYNPWKPGQNRGEPVYNRNFDITQPEMREALRDFCDDLEKATCGNAEKYCEDAYPNQLAVPGTLNCPTVTSTLGGTHIARGRRCPAVKATHHRQS